MIFAGKTTLLDTLAGRLPAAASNSLQGELRINGEARDYKTFRQLSAYVLQADYFFAELTVRETIALSAMLRLPSHISAKTKMHRVDQVCEKTFFLAPQTRS